jgi:membrane fusion protein, heavy metal efflux system
MKMELNRTWPYCLIAAFAVYTGGWFHSQYVGRTWPFVSTVDVDSSTETASTAKATDHGHDHTDAAHAGHDHAEHSDVNSLEISASARKNLGLTEEYLQAIELKDYQQSIAIPSIIVERPGRTRTSVSAGMTGIVTHVHATTGQAVKTGDLILEMQLTHEDLVTAQKDFLQSLGDRDVEMKEIARIEEIANSGAISSKTLLERQYSRDKLDSLLRSQRESLRLHGLTEPQIETIVQDRRLLTEIRVFAPNSDGSSKDDVRLLVLQELLVRKGQSVMAGETLCTLGDYDELLVEGQAFETDIAQITAAKLAGRSVSAMISAVGKVDKLDNLALSWVSNEVDPATRTLKFYVSLKNEIVEDKLSPGGERYISWKYRVGQRLEIGVPVAEWKEQIVLPVDAVVREGIDSFVFQENGDHFDRVPVHEKFRDQTNVVIDNDGALFPGDVVALRGAYQMQMALKSKAGSAIDPHAGHSH